MVEMIPKNARAKVIGFCDAVVSLISIHHGDWYSITNVGQFSMDLIFMLIQKNL